jgi:hypothetical protein
MSLQLRRHLLPLFLGHLVFDPGVEHRNAKETGAERNVREHI